MIKLPSGIDINILINDLRIISWQACEILLYYSRIVKDSNNKNKILKNKNLDSPITIADLKVNDLIIQKINEKYKNINWQIISEENAKIEKPSFEEKFDWTWVLDPLDGTKDFIQGTQDYAMHLSLNYRQRPHIGVVLIPEKDELWISYGEQVWCEKKNGIKFGPNLSKNNNLEEMILVTSKNHNNPTLSELIQKINFNEVKVMGSIGCKIASIIRGESDIYICLSLPGKSSPKDWDLSAPEAILRASGGEITYLDNTKLIYGDSGYEQKGVIIATNNKKNHERICLEIKQIIERYYLLTLDV